VLNPFGKIEHVLESTGIPLGYIPDVEYKRSGKYKLTPNNIVIILSDGITEAQNIEEVEFGYERVLDIIYRNQEATSKCILEQLFQEVSSYTQNQPQQDDITGIICKVNGVEQ
jgi:sigma-B regulation protein RsbU (phosphoserine phosphatase)